MATKFQDFVQNIPHGMYAKFRDELLRRLEPRVTDQTFRNWERGKYEPDDTRREAINQVAQEITGKTIY